MNALRRFGHFWWDFVIGDDWRIAVRRSTVEIMFIADASVLQSSFFADLGYIKGSRDRTDPSYARPLTLDTPAERW